VDRDRNETNVLGFVYCRDDLTVEVIFFGNSKKDQSGTITINEEATAPRGAEVVEEVRAKL